MSGKRIELDGVNVERGGQQFVSGRGLFKDGYTNVHRIETHGLLSMPVKGAKALLISPNDDPDQAYVIGGEHPSHRPQDIPSGGTAIYDANGNIISLVGAKIRLVAPLFEFVGNITLQGDLNVTGNIHATGSIIDEGGNTANHGH
ncbi:phage baseplate assembly protein [Agrobacterium sp. AGB01]|uniref:phage baseplate assembly protein domain-containing protein n=1 Tax=Agrobacterium sp. AGB01 TaxID=2769302 RepID=UPI00178032F5|nr:phage baseplate assembly protein [Agrobacterium sp. AGB01]MBD9390123.1 phage baseplate assembly protein [Agrobacterium sp. AGB01]